MQKWLLSFLLIFSVPALATPTANVTDLASLQQQLSQHEIVRGDFTQQRHLEMFSQPLTSKGQFTLSKTHGLLWQQTEPFALQEQFTLDFSVENNQWQLVLVPKQSPLNAVFQSITLSGKTHIDRLTLQELRGDKTEITFTNQTSLPQELTDAEDAQFRF